LHLEADFYLLREKTQDLCLKFVEPVLLLYATRNKFRVLLKHHKR